MTGQPWFFPLLFSDPICRRYTILFLLGFFGFLIAAAKLLSVLQKLADDLWDLYELSQPVEIFFCSPHCEIRFWDGMAEFVRSGACIGRIQRGVSSIRWTGGKTDRIIEISYGDGRVDSFHCGPMGWQEARRAASAAMRYTGRHVYG